MKKTVVSMERVINALRKLKEIHPEYADVRNAFKKYNTIYNLTRIQQIHTRKINYNIFIDIIYRSKSMRTLPFLVNALSEKEQTRFN